MPAGIGYGAMSKALSSARGFFGRYATEAAKVGGLGSGAARYAAGMSNSTMASVAGAGLGGAYGAVSEDTSVIGGALGGAALGFGAMKSYGAAARGLSRYGKMTARGVGRTRAASTALSMAANDTKSYIGNTIAQAPNAIRSTLKAGAAWEQRNRATIQGAMGRMNNTFSEMMGMGKIW